MLFHNYLETLLGSKAKIKILRVLGRYETKKFTSRELAMRALLSHTAVLKALPELQEMNVVFVEKHGTSHLVTINKESYCYGFLKSLFEAEKGTIEGLKKRITKAFPEADAIILFGSIADKKEEINSDIDILIITKNKEVCEERVAKEQTLWSKLFGNVIAASIMTRKEFEKKKNTPFVKDLLSKRYIVIKETLS